MANRQRLGGVNSGYPSNYNSDDNSGRGYTYDYQAPVYAATLSLVTTEAETIVQIALTGALALNVGVGSATTAPYIGDKLRLLFTNDTNTRVVTWGTGLTPTATTLSNTSGKSSTADFVFNGTTWVGFTPSTTA